MLQLLYIIHMDKNTFNSIPVISQMYQLSVVFIFIIKPYLKVAKLMYGNALMFPSDSNCSFLHVPHNIKPYHEKVWCIC